LKIKKRIMAIQKQQTDGIYVSHLLNCECYIQTSVGIFIQDIFDHRSA
jgi:hypothetical protein